MTKFVLLYNGGSMPEGEAAQAAVMQAWNVWFGQLGAALVDGGQPFTPQATRIAPDGTVEKGAGGTPASGYSIIEADSHEAAVALAKGCPVLQGGAQITVYETFPVM
jgi:hypothetical protein